MARKRIKQIYLYIAKEKRFFSSQKILNLSEIKKLKSILSEERIKLIFTIKINNPNSIYELAKLVKRDLKAVRKDLKILQAYGILRLVKAYKKRKKLNLKPELLVDEIHLYIII